MNSVEDYARTWAKAENSDVNSLSEWVKSIRKLVKKRIGRLRKVMTSKYDSIFTDPQVSSELSELHDKFILTPVDKASNNIVFVCKKILFRLPYPRTWFGHAFKKPYLYIYSII